MFLVERLDRQVGDREKELEKLETEQEELQARIIRKRKELRLLKTKHVEAIIHEGNLLEQLAEEEDVAGEASGSIEAQGDANVVFTEEEMERLGRELFGDIVST
jgi:hypothetical protein